MSRIGSRGVAERFAGLPSARAALAFACARHVGQQRAVDGAPFVRHPIEVGLLLHAAGYPDDVVAAGLLHDVLERTETVGVELDRRFGARVAHLVATLSEDPSIAEYGERKRELRERVEHAGSDALAIFAADKIAKVRELAPLQPWRLRSHDTQAKLAHYRACGELLRRVAPDVRLVERLNAELDQLGERASARVTASAPL